MADDSGSGVDHLLVGATQRGVCAVTLGDDNDQLEARLRREYPNAIIERDDLGLDNWVAPIVEQLLGKRQELSLPLDVQATAFQRQVWSELQKIPYGSTRSYAQIAADIGKPSSARAVARACASNPVALVVPCHRVVRSDGEAGGYRWGLERKRRLIAEELDRASKRRRAS